MHNTLRVVANRKEKRALPPPSLRRIQKWLLDFQAPLKTALKRVSFQAVFVEFVFFCSSMLSLLSSGSNAQGQLGMDLLKIRIPFILVYLRIFLRGPYQTGHRKSLTSPQARTIPYFY